jgi:spore germination protein KA
MVMNNKFPQIIKKKKKTQKDNSNKVNTPAQLPSQAKERRAFLTIDENLGFIKSILGDGIGTVEAKYSIFDDKIQAGVIYIDNLADKKLISSQIIEPLLNAKLDFKAGIEDIFMTIQSKIIYVPDAKKSSQMTDIIDSILNGYTVIFVDNIDAALIIESRKVQNRPIEKPYNEITTLASLDSLTEDIDTNCNLINKRLPIPDLRYEKFIVGKISHTEIKLLWIEGIANINMIQEVRTRIENINIDAVDGIGVLSELITDSPVSVFKTYRQTQRPDLIAKSLLNGQFVILCNNSPYGFLAPITFWDHFKTMDDYAEATVVASYLRLSRILSFIVSILVSPLYLAFVTFNHTIVPPALALNIATGRQGVPFPSVVEVLVLTFAITVIREASMRISGSVGFFIGTLSAIVIGQASVSAGYVSASLIILLADFFLTKILF